MSRWRTTRADELLIMCQIENLRLKLISLARHRAAHYRLRQPPAKAGRTNAAEVLAVGEIGCFQQNRSWHTAVANDARRPFVVAPVNVPPDWLISVYRNAGGAEHLNQIHRKGPAG